ncbi:MAG TPA: alkaline phosphatase family protein [Polyangia bacterium]|nr:alkaline phosphatase family protein [Polyangia bacterium]
MRRLLLVLLLAACAPSSDDRRLILVTLDGTRWQEVFRGADPALWPQDTKTPPLPYAGSTAAERRRALMPFLWDTVVARGQIFGDLDAGSRFQVQNPHRVSYPGYHDMLSGFTSLDINGNEKVPNPDLTVLEWLNDRPRFRRRVAVFASWELFPFILNVERSGLLVDAGLTGDRTTLLDRLRGEVPPPWRGSIYDAFTVEAALRHLSSHDVRVLHLALGDPDEWGHAGRYDRYLEAIHRADGWIAELWNRLEAQPAFRGRTSLIVTTDHGRGNTPQTWRQHSPTTAGAEEAWLAVMGPSVPATGERRGHPTLSLAQVAATAAQLVGEDFRAAAPEAKPPLSLR